MVLVPLIGLLGAATGAAQTPGIKRVVHTYNVSLAGRLALTDLDNGDLSTATWNGTFRGVRITVAEFGPPVQPKKDFGISSSRSRGTIGGSVGVRQADPCVEAIRFRGIANLALYGLKTFPRDRRGSGNFPAPTLFVLNFAARLDSGYPQFQRCLRFRSEGIPIVRSKQRLLASFHATETRLLWELGYQPHVGRLSFPLDRFYQGRSVTIPLSLDVSGSDTGIRAKGTFRITFKPV